MKIPKNFALNKPKIQKKQLSATIAFALLLTILASLIVNSALASPVLPKISPSMTIYAEPNTVGIGQGASIQAELTPPPPYDVNVTVTMIAPNGTSISKNWTLTGAPKNLRYTFYPDALGLWTFKGAFLGDALYNPATAGGNYIGNVVPLFVQQAQVVIPGMVTTISYAEVIPKHIATGESVYIVTWVQPATEFVGRIYTLPYEVVITKPDGSTESVFKTPDSPATVSFTYVCSVPGTYSVMNKFKGDWIQKPSESPKRTWVVEDDYVTPRYPDMPLPTGAWSYPINAEYRDWFWISGAWGQEGNGPAKLYWNEYTKGPNTAHVIWTKEYGGGIIGGDQGNLRFGNSAPSIVAWQGRIFMTASERIVPSTTTTLPSTASVLICYDQFTGELIYKKTLPGTGSGGELAFELQGSEKADSRQGRTIPAKQNLWVIGSGLRQVNPWTGECSYYNSTFTPTYYYDGAMYRASYNSTAGESFLMKWDTQSRSDLWSVPMGRDSRTGDYIDTTVSPAVWVRLSVNYGQWPLGTRVITWNTETGDLICNGTDVGLYTPEGAPGRYNVGWGNVYMHADDRCVYAFSETTGKIVWKSEPQSYPWGAFDAYNTAGGYNMVFFNSWDGYQYAYAASNGKLMWKTFSGDSLGENAMGAYGWYGNTVVGDGKVYTATGEHTPPNPVPRGNQLICQDAFTGEIIWRVYRFLRGSAETLSSGVLTYGNANDGNLYAFAKGPSATTVSAPNTAVPLETAVTIQGTVTDQSPGAPGTPAVSDASQGPWMQYLYMNDVMPTNATGVTVFLQAMTSDFNVIDITHVTTDIMGHYEYAWTPPAEGIYKILATFEQTEAYYSSSEECALTVGPAQAAQPVVTPAPTEVPTPTPTPIATASPSPAPIPGEGANTALYVGIAAVVIIAVIAAVAFVLKRRK